MVGRGSKDCKNDLFMTWKELRLEFGVRLIEVEELVGVICSDMLETIL
jgi:hypothetical protein